jgi:putative two-component system response regulator
MPNGPLLLIDDEPHNLAALRQILSSDYPMVFARSGAEGIAAARKHQPSLILLDIQMPDMDGYTACRALKQDPATGHIPVIFVTTLSEVHDETNGFNAGVVDFIVKPVSPPIVRTRVRTHLSLVKSSRLEQSYREAIFMLGEAGHYNDTGVHIWRMAAYAHELAAACDWVDDDCRCLEMAAPMHDADKIGIPGSILRKPGKLDADEWVVMKTHTRIGYDILSRSDAHVFKLAAEIALRHHEKWDGSGYPDGLAGEAIPESARIVALADVFDALTMKWLYKEAWPIERAMDTIHESGGSHFEPRLVGVFDAILPRLLEIKNDWAQRESH